MLRMRASILRGKAEGQGRLGPLKSRSDWQQAPPPQMNQERGAALALPRQSGTTLFSSFLGRGGEEEKDV